MINANGLDHLSEDEVSLAAVEKITTFLWPAHLGKNDVKICKICTYTYLYIYIYIHVCVTFMCKTIANQIFMKKWDNNYTVPKKSVEHKQRHKQKKKLTTLNSPGNQPPTTNKQKNECQETSHRRFVGSKKHGGLKPRFGPSPVSHDKVAVQPYGLNRGILFDVFWYRPAWKQQTYQR